LEFFLFRPSFSIHRFADLTKLIYAYCLAGNPPDLFTPTSVMPVSEQLFEERLVLEINEEN